jgi:hypothetical protein
VTPKSWQINFFRRVTRALLSIQIVPPIRSASVSDKGTPASFFCLLFFLRQQDFYSSFMYSWTTSLVLNGLLRAPPTLKAATNFATVGGGDASNNLIIRCSDVDAIFNVAAHRGQVKTTAKQWDGVLETFPSESDCTILQKGPRFEYEWASFGGGVNPQVGRCGLDLREGDWMDQFDGLLPLRDS